MATKKVVSKEKVVNEATILVEQYMQDRAIVDRCNKILDRFDDILLMPRDIVKEKREAQDRIDIGAKAMIDEMARLLDDLITVVETQDTQLKSDRN